MELITAQLESLVWVFSPAGIVIAVVLFAFAMSGLAGRMIPDVEVSSSARRSARQSGALDAAPQSERILP